MNINHYTQDPKHDSVHHPIHHQLKIFMLILSLSVLRAYFSLSNYCSSRLAPRLSRSPSLSLSVSLALSLVFFLSRSIVFFPVFLCHSPSLHWGAPARARAQPVRFGQEEQPGPAAGRGGADVPREGVQGGG
jgi:hypothetical protein